MVLFRAWSCASRAAASGPEAQLEPMPAMGMGPGHGPVYGHGMLRAPNNVLSSGTALGCSATCACCGRQVVQHIVSMKEMLHETVPSGGLASQASFVQNTRLRSAPMLCKHAFSALQCKTGLQTQAAAVVRGALELSGNVHRAAPDRVQRPAQASWPCWCPQRHTRSKVLPGGGSAANAAR